MSIDPERLRVGRDRITRVFRYLQALNQHRNPAKRQIREQLWSLWFKDLPQHPTIQRGNHTLVSKTPDNTLESDASDVEEPIDDFVLKVRRPKLTQPLRPPEIIAPWLESGWENPDRDVHVSESRNEIDADGESLILRFDDDPERIHAFEIWRDKREQWARNERPARKAMRVFEELYESYGRIQREAERVELVLGDGILNWYRPEGGVHHPILLQRLQLEFNPQIPQFTLVETEHVVELYSALFQSMDDVDGKAIAQCRNELEQGDFHPLADGATSGFLKRLIMQLSSRGEFITDGSPQGEMDYPRIGRDPVIFLRPRTLGFAVAIEAVLQDLEEQKQLPDSLLNVVGVEAQLQDDITEPPPIEPWEEPEKILFSKPANPEQFRIAKQLENHGGVLVQGPPGTGKSHTIANLIGHLLAHGKSVLVTSHATKALRVLRGHVVEQLQPLCLSVLESDIESRSQLESSVTAIVERLSTSDDRRLSEQGHVLAIQRNQLIKKLQDTRQELAEARWNEYRDIVLAGQGFSPSEAARRVSKGEQSDSWIPGPVSPGIPLPLSHGELIDLYRSNTILKSTDEVELSQSLPDPTELLPPEEFSKLADTKRELDSRNLQFRSDLWNGPSAENGAEDLRALSGELHRAMELIDSSNTLNLATLLAGRKGGANRDIWDTLLAMVKGVTDDAASAQETLLRYAPSLGDSIPLEEQCKIADEIIDYLSAGRKLGSVTLLVHPSWKRFIREARVVNGQPQHVEQFQALRSMIGLKIARNELAGRWDRQVAVLGAPKSETFGEAIENDCMQISDEILRCLIWNDDVLKPLEAKLKALSLNWESFIQEQPPQLGTHGDLLRLRNAVLDRLPKVLASRADLIDRNRLEAKIEALTQKVYLASDGRASSKVSIDLTEAIRTLDTEAYCNAFQRLVELYNLLTTYKNRHELLARLEVVAQTWARSIRDRIDSHGGHDLPGDVPAAWLWRQLNEELERRGATSLEDLQQKVLQLTEDLRKVTAELIDKRAWESQVRRTNLHQRQALIGWLDTVRKIGRGTGKRVPRLRAEAAQRMTECRTAVPVWIMPLTRVVENFDFRVAKFDVVIIDEASQSDVMALLAFYLGKKIVVVGDHEQVSPSAVGQKLSVVQHLIDEYLGGIPNAILYDGQMSVYDLARQSFGGAICLLEHFRCVPEIIQFSNQLSYNGQIKPLRDHSSVNVKPYVIPFRVNAHRESSGINREEVWTVASLMAAAMEQLEYKNKTFGAVSLVGEEQAQEIQRLLLRHVDPKDHEAHRILCGNAAQFQGDERDIMFLSIVDVPSGSGPLANRVDQRFKQRFNVAASRARDQMWVIYSLDPQVDLKPEDLRRRLIAHAEDPFALLRAIDSAEAKAESELEKAVLKRLIAAGYRVTPQWKVGYYRIDMVVEGGGKRLAIECDGDKYHPIEKLPEDMARQAILERLGWTFSRIRGSQFYRNPEVALQPVFERLGKLGIQPEFGDSNLHQEDNATENEIKDRIIRRAQEIRQEWQNSYSEANRDEGDNEDEEDTSSKNTNGERVREDPSEDREDGAKGEQKGTQDSSEKEERTEEKTRSNDVEWAKNMGASSLRRLHKWAKEKGGFPDSEVKSTYWVAENIARKKKISPTDARRAKRIYERAVSRGFSL